MSSCVDCGASMDDPLVRQAYQAHVMGSGVMCRACLEAYHGTPLAQVIAENRAFDDAVNRGLLVCDVCGLPGARPCPGEGQNLCERCNTRQGVNRWC